MNHRLRQAILVCLDDVKDGSAQDRVLPDLLKLTDPKWLSGNSRDCALGSDLSELIPRVNDIPLRSEMGRKVAVRLLKEISRQDGDMSGFGGTTVILLTFGNEATIIDALDIIIDRSKSNRPTFIHVRAVHNLISSSSELISAKAAEALLGMISCGMMEDYYSMDLIADLAKAPSPSKLYLVHCIAALAKQGKIDEKQFDLLIPLLSSGETGLAAATAIALDRIAQAGKATAKAISPLNSLLLSEDSMVRSSACSCLDAMATAGQCDVASLHILSDLFDDADEAVGRSARKAFLSIKERCLKDPVTARKFMEEDVAMDDDRVALPLVNYEGISNQPLVDGITSNLNSDDLVIRSEGLRDAFDQCEQVGDLRWIAPLIDILRNGSTVMRGDAAYVLAYLAKNGFGDLSEIGTLNEATDDASENVRKHALLVIVWLAFKMGIAEKSSLIAVNDALDDQCLQVRTAAAWASVHLTNIGLFDRNNLVKLTELAMGDTEKTIPTDIDNEVDAKRAAIAALAGMAEAGLGFRPALPILEGHLSHPDVRVVMAALNALKQSASGAGIVDPSSARAIAPLLSDPRYDVRVEAIKTLKELASRGVCVPACVEPVMRMMNEESLWLRKYSTMAWEEMVNCCGLGIPEAIPIIERNLRSGHPSLEKLSITALGAMINKLEMGEASSITPLNELLRNKNDHLDIWAASAISDLASVKGVGTEESLLPLMGMLPGCDSNRTYWSMHGLGKLADIGITSPEAFEKICGLFTLWNDDWAKETRNAFESYLEAGILAGLEPPKTLCLILHNKDKVDLKVRLLEMIASTSNKVGFSDALTKEMCMMLGDEDKEAAGLAFSILLDNLPVWDDDRENYVLISSLVDHINHCEGSEKVPRLKKFIETAKESSERMQIEVVESLGIFSIEPRSSTWPVAFSGMLDIMEGCYDASMISWDIDHFIRTLNQEVARGIQLEVGNQSVRAMEMLRTMALTHDFESEYYSESVELMIKLLDIGTAEEMAEAAYGLGTILWAGEINGEAMTALAKAVRYPDSGVNNAAVMAMDSLITGSGKNWEVYIRSCLPEEGWA